MSGLSERGDNPLRLVIDAVGFVRSSINPRSAWGAIVFVHSEAYTIVISNEIEDEILDVLDRPSITRKFDQLSDALGVVMDTTLAEANRVELGDIPKVCRDPNDDKVLATAVTGSVDFIATEDKDLLDLVEYEGIRIVNGVEILRILRR